MVDKMPIGSKYDVYYPKNANDNSSGGTMSYEVIAHVLCARFPGDSGGHTLNEVKAIAWQEDEPII